MYVAIVDGHYILRPEILFYSSTDGPQLDEDTITISSQPLRNALTLTTPDRRWIDFLTQTVNDTWDDGWSLYHLIALELTF